MKQPAPLCKFRVYPTRKGLFFHVFVWRTLRDFRAANPGNSKALGLCRGEKIIRCRRGKKVRVLPKIGEIHFIKKHLLTGILVHESGHAALRWMERVGLGFSLSKICDGQNTVIRKSDPEERFCYVLGDIAKQIVNQAHKRKLIL